MIMMIVIFTRGWNLLQLLVCISLHLSCTCSHRTWHCRLIMSKWCLFYLSVIRSQLMIIMCVSAVFACLGFLSPANRGSLMTCVLVLYVCLGTPAGYVSARIYKSKFIVTIMMMMMMVVVVAVLFCHMTNCDTRLWLVKIRSHAVQHNWVLKHTTRKPRPPECQFDITFHFLKLMLHAAWYAKRNVHVHCATF